MDDGEIVAPATEMEEKISQIISKILESNHFGWARMMAPVVMGNPDRPELAGALELVNRIGHNPGDIMAVVLEDGPLDATRPAEDLTTRLRLVTDPHASAPNMTEPAATDDSGSELGRTLDRPSW